LKPTAKTQKTPVTSIGALPVTAATRHFFVQLRAIRAKAIFRTYVKNTAAPGRVACRHAQTKTFETAAIRQRRSNNYTDLLRCMSPLWPKADMGLSAFDPKGHGAVSYRTFLTRYDALS
jgi:hypothetical protein